MSLALSLLVSFCPLFRLRVDSHIELEFIDALAHIICLLRSITLFDSRPTCLHSFDDADAARAATVCDCDHDRRRRVCLLDRARPPLSPSLPSSVACQNIRKEQIPLLEIDVARPKVFAIPLRWDVGG